MNKTISAAGIALMIALPLGGVSVAHADAAENAGCWGQATKGAAPLGDHAKDINAGGPNDSRNGGEHPGRDGLGNLAGAQDGGADMSALAGALGVDCSDLALP